MGLTQQEIENKLRQFETRITNLEAYKSILETDKLWKLRQQVEGNCTIIENLRSNLNPLLERQIWNNGYLSDMVQQIDTIPNQIKEVQSIAHADNAYLQDQIYSLQDTISKISINADAVGMALKKMGEKLSELTPTEDAQDNRPQELEGDLEIFDENDWIFDDPIKIYYDDEGREVWY